MQCVLMYWTPVIYEDFQFNEFKNTLFPGVPEWVSQLSGCL